MGGKEEQGGILRDLALGPMILSLARRQLRVVENNTFIDPDDIEFLLVATIRYMEALSGIAARGPRP